MLPPHGLPDDLAHLHTRWEDVHTRLRVQEQVLSDAIALYVKGKAERPEAMMEEVERMRAECSARFRALMEALKAQNPRN